MGHGAWGIGHCGLGMGKRTWGQGEKLAATSPILPYFHTPCPMPHAQSPIQNSTITGTWSLGWVNFLGATSIIQLVARSYRMGVR